MEFDVVDELFGKQIRVIFLDIDGVLHPYDAVPDSDFDGGQDPGESLLAVPGTFLPMCLHRLARLVQDTGAVIVLSSSWRCEDASAAEVGRQLAQYGIAVHGATPQGLTRGAEIAAWISDLRSEIAALVVLDDQDLRRELGAGNCIVVNGAAGLTDTDVDRAAAMLRRSACEDVAGDVLDSFRAAEAAHAAGWRPWMGVFDFDDGGDGQVDDGGEDADKRRAKKGKKDRKEKIKASAQSSGDDGEERKRQHKKQHKGKTAKVSSRPTSAEEVQPVRFEVQELKAKKNEKHGNGDGVKIDVEIDAKEHEDKTK